MNLMQFEEGAEIIWREHELHISRLLGSGMTANVYLAEMDGVKVAIKVLKPDVSDEIRTIFNKEPENLLRINSAWQENYPELPLIAPEYFGAEVDIETPFIVMELVQGKQLTEAASEAGGLKEEQVYWIGMQLGKMLTLLHEQLHRCYPDIKIDNFWLIENPDNPERPLLKITDWSILAEIDKDGVERDLFFSSMIMNYAFTGSTPEYARNRISTHLEDASKFLMLCSRTREFLNRSLSFNLSRRYQDSTAWLEEIEEMLKYWAVDGEVLMKSAIQSWNIFEQAMEDKKYDLAASHFDRGLVSLEIAADKGYYTAEYEEYWDRFQKHETEQSHLGRGRISLLGSGFEQAIQYFSEGADIYPQKAESLWRWMWLAKGAYSLGSDHFREVRENCLEAVEKLLAGNSQAAENAFDRIRINLGKRGEKMPDGFQHLFHEARILNLCKEAADSRSMGKFDKSADALREAESLSSKLPNDPPIQWANEFGDISTILDDVLNEKRTLGESNEHLKRAAGYLDEGDHASAASEYRLAFSKASESKEVVFKWGEALRQHLEAGDYEESWVLAEKLAGTYAVKNLANLHNTCHSLHVLGKKARSPRESQFIEYLEGYCSSVRTIELSTEKALRKILSQAYEAALDEADYAVAERIAGHIVTILPDLEQEIHQKMADAIRNRAQLMQEAAMASVMDAARARLEVLEAQKTAFSIVGSASALLDPSFVPGNDSQYQALIKETRQVFHKVGTVLKNDLDSQQRFNSERIESVNKRVTEIDKEIHALVNPLVSDYPFPMDKRLARAMALLAEWSMIDDPTNENYQSVRIMLFEKLTSFGVQAWRQMISEADYLLEGGYLEQARFLMEDLDILANQKMGSIDPKYERVHCKIHEIIQFENDFHRSFAKETIIEES